MNVEQSAGEDVERQVPAGRPASDILVNGTPEIVYTPRLSYWDVVKLGFPDAKPEDNLVYTIDYSSGPHQNPEGALEDGESVRVKDGMKFYVTPSDKS